MNRKLLISAAVAISSLLSFSVGTTHADPPASSGWDGTPDVAIEGGSDTTYLVSQRLETLYNGAPGCTITTSATSSNKAKCVTFPTASVATKSLSTNQAFLSFTAPHTITFGQTVVVATGDATFDGVRLVNGITPKTLNITTVTSNAFQTPSPNTNSFVVNQPVMFSASAGAPISVGVTYFVKTAASASFTVSATRGGAQITGIVSGGYTLDQGVSFSDSAADVATAVSGGSVTVQDTAVTNGNYDHDIVTSAAAAGSGAGINSLLPSPCGVAYNPGITFARSSRAPSSSANNGCIEGSSLTFWGYARDGIAVTTFGSRSAYKLSKTDLSNIYTCAVTDWGQIQTKDGTGADTGTFYPAGPIIAWDMNGASGTRASFVSLVGNITFGSCVRKLVTGVAPFENDVKPLLADPGPDETVGNADDDESNYIWWQSFGNWAKYPYTKNGCADAVGTYDVTALACTGGTTVNANLVAIDNSTPGAGNVASGTYTMMRTLYLVTKNTDADCLVSPGTGAAGAPCEGALLGGSNIVSAPVTGASGGPGGAVRNFVSFLCRINSADYSSNPVTGKNYRAEITSALQAEGFQPVTAGSGKRTTGYACEVLT